MSIFVYPRGSLVVLNFISGRHGTDLDETLPVATRSAASRILQMYVKTLGDYRHRKLGGPKTVYFRWFLG